MTGPYQGKELCDRRTESWQPLVGPVAHGPHVSPLCQSAISVRYVSPLYQSVMSVRYISPLCQSAMSVRYVSPRIQS
jgi:hypothetical protein